MTSDLPFTSEFGLGSERDLGTKLSRGRLCPGSRLCSGLGLVSCVALLSSFDPDPRDLLRPLMIWLVSARVNKPENDDPEVLEWVSMQDVPAE
jgi:hypothetical protein